MASNLRKTSKDHAAFHPCGIKFEDTERPGKSLCEAGNRYVSEFGTEFHEFTPHRLRFVMGGQPVDTKMNLLCLLDAQLYAFSNLRDVDIEFKFENATDTKHVTDLTYWRRQCESSYNMHCVFNMALRHVLLPDERYVSSINRRSVKPAEEEMSFHEFEKRHDVLEESPYAHMPLSRGLRAIVSEKDVRFFMVMASLKLFAYFRTLHIIHCDFHAAYDAIFLQPSNYVMPHLEVVHIEDTDFSRRDVDSLLYKFKNGGSLRMLIFAANKKMDAEAYTYLIHQMNVFENNYDHQIAVHITTAPNAVEAEIIKQIVHDINMMIDTRSFKNIDGFILEPSYRLKLNEDVTGAIRRMKQRLIDEANVSITVEGFDDALFPRSV